MSSHAEMPTYSHLKTDKFTIREGGSSGLVIRLSLKDGKPVEYALESLGGDRYYFARKEDNGKRTLVHWFM